MTKFISFDENSKLIARYDSAINRDIPADAVEVTDEQFWQTINERDGIWSITSEANIVKLPFPEDTIDDLIIAKRAQINFSFNQAMQQVTADYPVDEISSWTKQEAEARAFIDDENAVTPLIDALATARGITKEDLASRIIAKAVLFATVSGQLIGTRQGLEDQLDALAEDENTTAEDIDQLHFPL